MPGPSFDPQEDVASQGKAGVWVRAGYGMHFTIGHVESRYGSRGWVAPLGPAPHTGLADILKAQHGV